VHRQRSEGRYHGEITLEATTQGRCRRQRAEAFWIAWPLGSKSVSQEPVPVFSPEALSDGSLGQAGDRRQNGVVVRFDLRATVTDGHDPKPLAEAGDVSRCVAFG
jgi:hypothetical protein